MERIAWCIGSCKNVRTVIVDEIRKDGRHALKSVRICTMKHRHCVQNVRRRLRKETAQAVRSIESVREEGGYQSRSVESVSRGISREPCHLTRCDSLALDGALLRGAVREIAAPACDRRDHEPVRSGRSSKSKRPQMGTCIPSFNAAMDIDNGAGRQFGTHVLDGCWRCEPEGQPACTKDCHDPTSPGNGHGFRALALLQRQRSTSCSASGVK